MYSPTGGYLMSTRLTYSALSATLRKGHREEVHRDQVGCVIGQEGSPGLGRRTNPTLE
jgi:hypothetical protein